MKTKLINYFRKPFNLCALIGVTAGFILSYLLCISAGIFTPPTEADFSELHKKEEIIIEDFDNVYNLENITVFIDEEQIIVNIVSEEESDYLVKMIFSKDRKFISSEEISNKIGYETYPTDHSVDKMLPWALVVSIGIIFGLFLNVTFYEIYRKIKKHRK